MWVIDTLNLFSFLNNHGHPIPISNTSHQLMKQHKNTHTNYQRYQQNNYPNYTTQKHAKFEKLIDLLDGKP